MQQRTIQQELKKRLPFEHLEVETMLNILRSADLFSNRIGRLLREYGLTDSQYNVLRILRGEGQPLPSLEIASRMIQVVPAITGLIDRLEKMELVARRRCENDRRVVFVELLPSGRKLLKKIDQPLLDLHQKLLGHLSKKELTQLNGLLEKTRQSTQEETS